MLQRYREYLRDTPVQAWLTNVSCLFSVFAALNVAFPSRNNFGMANLNFGDILGWPTFLLLYRFSDQQQQKNPISAFQQKAVGILSLLALGSSVAAKRAPTLYTYLGLTILPSVEVTMLAWFMRISALGRRAWIRRASFEGGTNGASAISGMVGCDFIGRNP